MGYVAKLRAQHAARSLQALLLGDGSSRSPLAQILLDRFGNYLAQRAWLSSVT